MNVKNLDSLTSLRFFAAFSIIVLHSRTVYDFEWANTFLLGQGVTFFFVLSGFILTYVYNDKIHIIVDSFEFWKLRIARLWPAHLAAGGLATLLSGWSLIQYLNEPVALLSWLTMTHAWFGSDALARYINGPSWSISNEMFFYALFPLILMARPYVKYVVAAYFLLFAAALAYLSQFGTDRIVFDSDAVSLIYFNPVFRLGEFLFGSLLGRFFVLHRSLPFTRERATVLEVLVISLTVVFIAFGAQFAEIFRGPDHVLLRQWIMRSGGFPLFGALILVLAYNQGALSTALAWPPLILGGEISYSLYLVHKPILVWFSTQSVLFLFSPLAAWCAAVLTTFALSLLIYEFVETPFRKAFAAKTSQYWSSLRGAWSKAWARRSGMAATGILVLAGGAVAASEIWQQSLTNDFKNQVASNRTTSIAFEGSGMTLETAALCHCSEDLCAYLGWRIDETLHAKPARSVVKVISGEGEQLLLGRTEFQDWTSLAEDSRPMQVVAAPNRLSLAELVAENGLRFLAVKVDHPVGRPSAPEIPSDQTQGYWALLSPSREALAVSDLVGTEERTPVRQAESACVFFQ